MDYLKANYSSFSIAEYFKHVKAQSRETAEKDFKSLVRTIGDFEKNKKNKPLIELSLFLRKNKFEILLSEEAEEYWTSFLSKTIERKRVHAHLISESTIADAILDDAKKRLKSKASEIEQYEISSSQQSDSTINETNVWEVWSEVINQINCMDTINIDEYSLERLGIVQLGDNISNHTTRVLFAPSLVQSSNNIIRTTQTNVFEKFKDFHEAIFESLDDSLGRCEKILLKNALKVKEANNSSLTFCYDMYMIFVKQVFIIGGLEDSESSYNHRLLWRLFDVVVEPLKNCKFIPGEVRLMAIKNELERRQLNLSNYYNADGCIIDEKNNLELVLLETSGSFNSCTTLKKNTDHLKAAYGLLAMLNTIAHKYCHADVEMFKTLKVYFVHAAGSKIRLWSFNLATQHLYVLNRQRSCEVPTQAKQSKENVMAVVNLMWELKDAVTESCMILEKLAKSHKENVQLKKRAKLLECLGETVNVKLPPSVLFSVDDLNLSSSPLRPPSINSFKWDNIDSNTDEGSFVSKDSDYTDK